MTRLSVFLRLVFLVMLGASVAGCASDEDNYASMPREPGHSSVMATGQKPLQCVPYAREHSAVKIYGDAWTWWDQAAGKFPRGSQPEPGAVMVLNNYAGSQRGHVAVVRKIISTREIRVDHANWLDDGSIYLNDPVEDVSADNDWSKVRVYNIKTGGWGANTYPVQGFIGSSSDSVLDGRAAPRSSPRDGLPTSEEPAPVLSARTVPDPANLVPARAPVRHVAPSRNVPAAAPDDDDPLPNPDMVVSANIP